MFNNLIHSLQSVVETTGKNGKLPAEQREAFYEVMGETYQMITATLLMVIIRLKDILMIEEDVAFMEEVEQLSNFDGWYEAERQFRLCQGLRRLVRELEDYHGKWTDKAAVKDWDELLATMHGIFATETEVAGFISEKLWTFSEQVGEKSPKEMRRQVKALREILMEERKALLEQETRLYSTVI